MSLYTNPWFEVRTRVPDARLRLFCFPYAGGSVAIFQDWSAALPAEVEVIAVHYPGRGRRSGEPLIDNCRRLVDALLPQILPWARKPFAFFGHSNGGLVSFELARALQAQGVTTQKHHFISATRALQLPRTQAPLSGLPNEEFAREVANIGGTPRELLEHPESMEFFLPVLRADFALSESYNYEPAAPLRSDATLLFGRLDEFLLPDEQEHWGAVIAGRIDSFGFDAGHFFINTHKKQLLSILDIKLRQLLSYLPREHWAL